MLLSEFDQEETVADVQQNYFLQRLPFRHGGRYYYRVRGLRAKPGTVVLFKCDQNIIATAVFVAAKKSSDRDGFSGYLEFDIHSIQVFDPVGKDVWQRIWPNAIEARSDAKLSLEPHRFPIFEKQLTNSKSPQFTLSADAADQSDGVGDDPQQLHRWPIVERQIRQRRGQREFRDALRQRYGDQCLVTGCRVLAVLEAAHITPCREESDNRPDNGLLLRSDIHTLFDLYLLGIEPMELRVELHTDLAKEYGALNGITLPCRGRQQPSTAALRQRYAIFRERVKRPL